MSKLPSVIFGPEIWSLQNEGGISRYFQELIHGLSELGVGGKVLTQNYANPRLGTLDVEGFEIESLSDPNESFKEAMKRLGEEAQSNIFHPTYYSKDHVDIREPRTKIVVTVFDMISELFPEKKPRFRRVIDEKKISVHKADHILAISSQTKNDLINMYGVPAEKISVTYLGSKLHLLPKKDISTIRRGRYILYVGKRGGYKNFINFLTAYSHSESLKSGFSIVAVGGGEFTPNENSDLQKLGITGKVKQVDADDIELSTYYRKAACLVYPSLYEGFGLPPVEAMSLNCPVIASTGGSIPEICKEAAEYFDPADVDSIEHVISTTLGDEQRLREMRQTGLEVADLFTWEKTASTTLDAYKKVIG
jgi:glycosyltransferase involved in cell wall biosynthesis